jgi:hypothetical protein
LFPAQPATHPEQLELSGTTEFEAPTNVPAVSVKGKSNAVQGRLMVARDGDKVLLERLEARCRSWRPAPPS